jgi:hypothetical protein
MKRGTWRQFVPIDHETHRKMGPSLVVYPPSSGQNSTAPGQFWERVSIGRLNLAEEVVQHQNGITRFSLTLLQTAPAS